MASTTFSGPVTSTNGFIGSVTGNVTGDVTGTLIGNQTIPTATVAATGSSNTNAAAVTLGFTLVSAADGTKGVKLPTAVAGSIVIIKNGAAAILKIYPNTSDKINGGTATIDSLQSGAVYGFAGLIDGIVGRLREELDAPSCPVVATGGLSVLIAEHCTTITSIDAQLTLTGLRLIWERASAAA